MRATIRFISCTLCLLLAASVGLPAQEAPTVDHSYKPLKLNLNEDGSKYIRFIIWHQQWLSSSNLSAPDNGEAAELQLTSSIRRSRMLAFAQVSPRFLILTHFGLNGLNPGNLTSLGGNGDAPQLFLHDAWVEFMVNKNLYIGSGLHYWKGLTRLSNQSTLNFMTLDQSRPFVHWHSLGITDQFARHLGVYAKGSIDKFDYRIAFNNPGRNGIRGNFNGHDDPALSYDGVNNLDKDGNPTGNTIVEGYFRYQLADQESTKLPYAVGSYLGKKNVLAIGAGFYAHPNGIYNSATETHEAAQHFAADVFLDTPTANGGCINAYASVMRFNYGDNYIARWAGTGTVLYGHLGYLIPKTKFMPYVAYQSGNYDAFEDPTSALDVGVNYFINGHNAKITLEYHRINNDPREDGIGTTVTQASAQTFSQLRMQAHIFL
ncbi:MAG: porin [Bacteroidota bacterium]